MPYTRDYGTYSTRENTRLPAIAASLILGHADGSRGVRHNCPQPAGTRPCRTLVGVWCQSATACLATGGTNAGTLTERLTGTTWTVQRTPTQHTPGGFLASLWCQSATACLATGNTNAGTLAERLSGGVRHLSLGDGDAVLPQDGLALVLVDLHWIRICR